MTSTPCARPNNGGYNEKETSVRDKQGFKLEKRPRRIFDGSHRVPLPAMRLSSQQTPTTAQRTRATRMTFMRTRKTSTVWSRNPTATSIPLASDSRVTQKENQRSTLLHSLWLFASSQKLRPGKRLPATRGLSSGFFACLKPVGTCTKQFCLLRVLKSAFASKTLFPRRTWCLIVFPVRQRGLLHNPLHFHVLWSEPSIAHSSAPDLAH